VTTTLLLTALLVLPAQANDDPEPPVKKGIVARLVAKKSTYKLDLQGGTADEYKKAIAAGTAAEVSIDVDLVITNHTKGMIRVRTTGTSPALTLSLKGKGAEDARPKGGAAAVKNPITYTVLKPGEKVTIPIKTLASVTGTRVMSRHYWTEPGDYVLEATYRTRIDLNYDPNVNPKSPFNYEILKPRPITLKVEK
jgi:hypothetical protein